MNNKRYLYLFGPLTLVVLTASLFFIWGGPIVCTNLDVADRLYDDGYYFVARQYYACELRKHSPDTPSWKYIIEQIKSCTWHITDASDTTTVTAIK